MADSSVHRLLDLYPRIFFACHTRHVRDPQSRTRLSAHQAGILDHLDDVEPTSLTGLARHMGVTASTMSLGVDRLARHGYVVRARDPEDGRRVLLRLTAAGARIKEAQSVLEPERVRAMLDRLSADEQTQALRGLGLLAQAADEMMQARSAGALPPSEWRST
ncbi:MAG: MarR family winged helix-turn-helix transcriptional regulator [Gemmatimonadales bacterium]